MEWYIIWTILLLFTLDTVKGSENVLIGDERPPTKTKESSIQGWPWPAHSDNPEIGLHNTKYIAVHLDNPEGQRQLLCRSLFEAKTWFLILGILKGRNHSNLL